VPIGGWDDLDMCDVGALVLTVRQIRTEREAARKR
jgi:hypothetical protein